MKLTKLIFSAPTTSWSPLVVVELLMLSLSIILIQITNLTNQASAFHLSFGHRLLKAATNLNPASSLIRPIECRNSNNHSEAGICMFSIDCMHNKGVPLSVCKHNYFVGTCCRLPDYNNFVGIVYDLRDTETNQLMEARRISPEIPKPLEMLSSTSTSASSSSPSSMSAPISLSSTQSAISYSPTQNYSTATQEFSTTDSLSPSRDNSHTSSSLTGLPSSTTKVRDDFEADKYIISSTKLFAPPTAPPATTTTTPLTHEQEHNKSHEVLKTNQQQQNTGESARNADGGSFSSRGSQLLAAMMNYTLHGGNNKHNGQLVALPSELDSFQIHSELAQSNQTNKINPETISTQLEQPKPVQNSHHNTYELIKDDNSDILVTVNSVHSPPTTQQHFNINELHNSPPETIEQRRPTQSTTQQVENKQSTMYSFEDQSQQKNQDHQLQQPVVFSNNHQQSSSGNPIEASDSNRLGVPSTIKSAPASSVMAQSDQEFTISSLVPTATNAPATTTTTLSSSSSSSSTVNSVEEHIESNSHNSLAGHSSNSPNSQESISKLVTVSPFVDLVSSNSAAQSTTPFTTSLSTASIPNISLHSHSPTTQTPNSPALVLSPHSSSSSPTQTSTTKQSNSPIQGSSQTTPQASSDGGDVSSLGFSQLYSNQHSGTSPQQQPPHTQQVPSSSPPTLQQPQSNHHNRPNFGILGLPQMASKIVTGSSSSNNLIPGLNGLQSAILSHIPFKIAGLSSGLSNYLQSATKPFGSRPLLSSNNAPALQYQQQMMNNQQNKSSDSSSVITKNTSQAMPLPGNVRFPGSSSNLALPVSSTVASSTAGIISSNNIEDQPIGGGSVVSWQLAQLPSSSSTTTNATALPTISTTSTALPLPISSHDVVKEAQLVCGRPQVNQINNQATTGNNEGKKRVARIVGGNQSLFGQWPWMVSLRQWRKGAFLHKCGAALLNENWAITAAHCVENVKVTDLLLRLGEFDVSNQAEPYPYIEKRVKSVVSHPSFDPKTFEYDLALLRFTEPIKYERNIIPVCVPTGNDSYVDRMATVIGWGRLYEDGPLPDIIQHVDVPIITNNECEKMYKNAGYIEEIPDMFICAGINKGGRDSCEGDSGGPLTMVDHDGRSYLVGIISWGIGCALPSQPGVYTRITAFSRWINQITAF